ncbi:hypothetical protein ACE1CI_06275 [Aerosakkonemataceae cyanobacterium BLCC-F50]|uniref:Uncharacterized protein n=1 Tax=Floridaenema flaviceps BLCC-F50 TaxID=3153642 RepID=A0ABV4XLX4_9CYAN
MITVQSLIQNFFPMQFYWFGLSATSIEATKPVLQDMPTIQNFAYLGIVTLG